MRCRVILERDILAVYISSLVGLGYLHNGVGGLNPIH